MRNWVRLLPTIRSWASYKKLLKLRSLAPHQSFQAHDLKMDPFDRVRLYSLLARRRVLEEFMKDQQELISFITIHIKQPSDTIKFLLFIKSLDLGQSDENYAMNLISSALGVKIQSLLNLLEEKDGQ